MDGGLAAGLRTAVDELLSVDVADAVGLGREGLCELICEVERQKRRLAAVDHLLIAAAGELSLAGEFGATSPADLLVRLLRVSPREAAVRVAQARDCGPRREITGPALVPILPATAAAVRAGDVSAEHVSVVARVLDRIPPQLAVEAAPVAERYLVDASAHLHPGLLARAGEQLLVRLNPDGRAPTEDEVQRRRDVSPLCAPGGSDQDGTSPWRMRLAPQTDEAFRTLLDTLSAPKPEPDGTADTRSAGQRRHDALHELLLRVLRSGDLDPAGGLPVTVLATTTVAELEARAGVVRTGHGNVWSVRELLALAGDQFADAGIVPVILDHDGAVLACGRTRRLASRDQRLALAARDGGCCFVGCDRPAAWCEAHHVVEWAAGGPTDLDNLCLLCAYHHRHFAPAGWRIVMINGVPHCIPPPWLDPEQRPVRNSAHHLPEIDFGFPPTVRPHLRT